MINTAGENGIIPAEQFAADQMKRAYHRGIISKVSENGQQFYILADFFTRLEYFMLEDKARWEALSNIAKIDLDGWYVAAYARKVFAAAEQNDGFDIEEVLPYEHAAARITAADEEIAIQDCDCRLFAEGCGKPVNLCIHFNARRPNSVYDRGYGKIVSKDEAHSVLKQADAAGLIHLVGDHSICNCCTCCCYPFRTALSRGTIGTWPQTPYIAVANPDQCANCGACIDRCYFGAIQPGVGSIVIDTEKCRGCGVCRTVCTSGALHMQTTN